MKEIFLIKAFDTAMWQQTTPIAFETEEEAEAYCVNVEKRHPDIIHTWIRVKIGSMTNDQK